VEQLTIFGPGLIGGSIALGAKARGLARRVVAIDRNGGQKYTPSERDRVADEWLAASDERAVSRAYEASELIVLACPVHSIIAELPRALSSGAVVTDAGSTKELIVRAAEKHPGAERFVAGHPMAGHPAGGLIHASPDLFVDKRWLLCSPDAAKSAQAKVIELARGLGAIIVELDASAHDQSVALTSHVPQLYASALAALAAERDATAAAGPGFASATRVAGGAEGIWRDIFETNGSAIAEVLGLLSAELDAVAAALRRGDAEEALKLLERARRTKRGSEQSLPQDELLRAFAVSSQSPPSR